MIGPQRDAEFGYKATKTEHHPSPVVNGRSTIEFFRESFQMSGREVVALMGAHTFGELIFQLFFSNPARQASHGGQPLPLHLDQQGAKPVQQRLLQGHHWQEQVLLSRLCLSSVTFCPDGSSPLTLATSAGRSATLSAGCLSECLPECRVSRLSPGPGG